MEIDWYARRDELDCGMVFDSCFGIVKLDHPKPGDGSAWVVANWSGSWGYYESTIEPSDLIGEPIPDNKEAIEAARI